MRVAHHEDIRLDHGVDGGIGFVLARQANVDRRDVGAAGLAVELVGELAKQLAGDLLMLDQRRR